MLPGKYIIHNAFVVNEGKKYKGNVWINGRIIEKVEKSAETLRATGDYKVVDATGKYLFPGVIDDQVHFREPGLEYKGDIYSESRAAVAGGITSFMEMPNTNPPVLSLNALEEKYEMATQKSFANYSFYMGTSNNNIEEVMKVDPKKVCGIKVFMGSSTGNLLVDDENALNDIFAHATMPVAVHCEDEETIQHNNAIFYKKFGLSATTEIHPLIRSAEACFLSSSKAVALAKKHGTRLHLLHLSTAREMSLLNNNIALEKKRITGEVCIHHLWFSDEDYPQKGNLIKWNPAIKTKRDNKALFVALLTGKLDVVATDHAPHTLKEKQQPYFKAPAGGPMVQHSLLSMLEFYHLGKIKLEQIVEKMCHNPAIVFNVNKRGYIRRGYFADLVLLDLNTKQMVKKENILYKCGWSPMEGIVFHSKVVRTFVNGNLVFDKGLFNEEYKGERLLFDR